MFPDLLKQGQVLAESDNFSLLPDIGPLIEDHLLVISKSHIPSFASVAKNNQEETREFIGKTLQTMHQHHPNSEIFAFEHGVGKINGQSIHCGTCNSTDHAHLHLLPLPERKDGKNSASIIANSIVSQYNLSHETIPGIPNIEIDTVAETKPYLYLWSSNEKDAHVLVQEIPACVIPSQIVRKMIAAESLGIKASNDLLWDWRNITVLFPKIVRDRLSSTIKRWRV